MSAVLLSVIIPFSRHGGAVEEGIFPPFRSLGSGRHFCLARISHGDPACNVLTRINPAMQDEKQTFLKIASMEVWRARRKLSG